jgi:hypothetical protein
MRKRKMVQDLIGDRARFLADYRVANYVKSAQITDIKVDGVSAKAPASVFFRDRAVLLAEIEGKAYKQPFNVVLFDSFIVIELAPRTARASFLVLVPNFESKTGSYVVGDTLESTSVTDTLNTVNQCRGQARLLMEAGNVLASLQSAAAAG